MFPARIRRKMRGKERTHLSDAMQECFGKVPALEARFHPLDNSTPEIVSAFGVHRRVTDHGKLVRNRGDEDQDSVPQQRLVHFQLCEASGSRMERVLRFPAADEDAYLSACPFFGGGNGRHNSVVIDSLEKMTRFHAESRFKSPAAARAATAAVAAATGKSTTATPAGKPAATPTSAASEPPDPAGAARP